MRKETQFFHYGHFRRPFEVTQGDNGASKKSIGHEPKIHLCGVIPNTLKHGGFGHRPLSFGEFVFLFMSSLLVFWSLRGCSRVWLLLDLKVTLPCCCLCVLSIPSLSLLQPLAKCPSIETWEISLLTAVLPLLVGGTTAPRYYRPHHGTTAASNGGLY